MGSLYSDNQLQEIYQIFGRAERTFGGSWPAKNPNMDYLIQQGYWGADDTVLTYMSATIQTGFSQVLPANLAQIAASRFNNEVGNRISNNTRTNLGDNYEILLDNIAQKELMDEIVEDLTQPVDPNDPPPDPNDPGGGDPGDPGGGDPGDPGGGDPGDPGGGDPGDPGGGDPGDPGGGDPGDPGGGDPGDPGGGGPGDPGGVNPGRWPPSPPFPPRDPLVLDLDGDGIELSSVSESETHFDFGSDGFAERTGWVEPDDGFLFEDSDGNTIASGISELFGSEEEDGFTELARHDLNSDYRIDAEDAIFSSLRIWRDLNSDGVSTANEVFSLQELNIASIGLERLENGEIRSGNEIRYSGTVSLQDGSVRDSGAVFFARNLVISSWEKPNGFVVDSETFPLPNLKGYGLLPDLNYSMTLSPSLLESVKNFVLSSSSMDLNQLKEAFHQILFEWANVENVALDAYGASIDGRHVAFLEKMFGSNVEDWSDRTVAGRWAEAIEQSFEEISGAFFLRVAAQVPINAMLLGQSYEDVQSSPVFAFVTLGYDQRADAFVRDFGDLKFTVNAVIEGGIVTDRLSYLATVMEIAKGALFDLAGGDHAVLREKLRDAFDSIVGVSASSALVSASHTYIGNSENETLSGSNVNDAFVGGRGDDTLSGKDGNDDYLYARGDGNDSITEGDWKGVDRLVFSDINAADVKLSSSGYDLIVTIAEGAPGAGDGGSIVLKDSLYPHRDVGVDEIVFANGSSWSKADVRLKLLAEGSTDGDDAITGSEVADVILGGRGDDTLSGKDGNDDYLYARGDGNDSITEGEWKGVDRLVFSDINAADVKLSSSGYDLMVTILESAPGAGDGGSIVLKDSLYPHRDVGVDKIVFANGDVWDKAQVRSLLLNQATDGDDTITGFEVADVINGRKGNDALSGRDGSDDYLYARGDGNDSITEGEWKGVDRLVFSDINAADIKLSRSGNDLIVTITESTPGAGDGGSAVLKNALWPNSDTGVDKIVFANGDVWDKAQVRALLLNQATDGDDTITGFEVADVINGRKGNDTLSGQGGNDDYLYARGDGNDTIIEAHGAGTNDRIKFTDINRADITATRNGTDLTLSIRESAVGAGDGGSIVLKGMLGSSVSQGIEAIEFADSVTLDRAGISNLASGVSGTSGDDTINGTAAADDIQAGQGNDRLIGAAGNDSYFYRAGDGNDTIEELANGTDIDLLVLADLNQADVRFERPFGALTDVVLRVFSTNQTITLKTQFDPEGGVEKIVFADGSVLGSNDWGLDSILLDLVTIYGTAGNDTVWGSTGNDVIDPGAGDDTYGGEYGNDTLLFGVGYGNDFINEKADGTDTDTLKLVGLNQSDVRFERPFGDLTDVVIRINATGETLTLDNQFDKEDGVERIIFADGTTLGGTDWSLDGILLNLVTIYGTLGNDTIWGSSGDDIIDPGAGNDTYGGEYGNDTLLFGVGYGNDFLNERADGTDTDTLKLIGLNQGDIEIERPSSDLTDIVLRIKASGETLTLDNQFDKEDGVERIVFANGSVLGGTDWSLDGFLGNLASLVGGAGNDTITGYAAKNDVIFGKGGNDTLNGLTGSDTFVFGSQFGIDTVVDFVAGAGTDDVLRFHSDVFASAVAVLAAASQSGADTVITYDTNNKIILKNVITSNLHIDDFAFF